MNAAEVQEKYLQSSTFFAEAKYVEALTTIEQLEPLLPNSLGLALLRARTVAALGRSDEAEAVCRRVATRLAEARREANAMRHSLGDEYGQLKRLLDDQEREYGALNEAVQEVLARSRKQAATLTGNPEATPPHPEVEELRARLRERERALRDAEGRLNDQEQAITGLRSEVAAWQQRLEEAAAARGAQTKELETWRLAAEDAQGQLDRMRHALEERQAALDALQTRAQDREADLAELHKQLGAAEAKVEHAAGKEKRLAGEIESLAGREAEKTQRLKQIEEEAHGLRQELAQRESLLQKAVVQHQESQQREEALRAALDAARADVEQAAARSVDLESRLNAERARAAEAAETARREGEQLQHALREHGERETGQRQQLEALQQALNAARADVDAAARDAADQAAAQYAQIEALQQAAQAAEAQALELRAQLAAREEQVQAAEAHALELSTQLAAREKELRTTGEAHARQEKLVEDLRAELASIQAHSEQAADSLSARMDALRAESDAARAAEAESTARAGALQEALGERDAALAALQADHAALLEQEKQAVALATAAESEQEHLHQALAQRERLLADAAGREQTLAAELEQLRASLRSGADDEQALNAELDRLRQAEAAHTAELARLRDETAQADEAHTHALAALRTELDAAHARSEQTADALARLERQEEAYRLQTAELEAAQQEIAALRAEAQTQRNDIEDIDAVRAEIASLRQEAEAARAAQGQLDAALRDIETLRDDNDRQKAALAEAQTALARQSEQILAAGDADELAKQLDAVRAGAAQAEAENKKLAHKLTLTEEEDKLRGRALDQAHAEMDKLRQALAKAAKRRGAANGPRSRRSLVAAAVLGAVVGAGALFAGISTGIVPADTSKTAVADAAAPVTLTFPQTAAGELFQRPATDDNAAWTALQPAAGSVSIPPGTQVQLRAASVTAAVDALPSLPPRALASLWLPQPPSTGEWDIVKAQEGLREVRVLSGYVGPADATALQIALPEAILVVDDEARLAAVLQAPGPRTVSFGNQNLGRLFVRPWDSTDEDAWSPRGNAAGDIALPAATALKLDADYDQGRDLSALARLDANALQALRLKGKHITDETLAHVAKLHGLRSLEVVGTSMTEQGLQHLSTLFALRHLNLNGADIGDPAMAVVSQFGKLEELDLAGTRISNESIQSLKRLTSLRRLNIAKTRISQEGSLMLSYDLSAEVRH